MLTQTTPIAAHATPSIACDVSVLIVCYRSRAMIADCLRGLFEWAFGVSFEVLLTDNSRDGTAELVQQEFRAVRVIPSSVNDGFGAANNRLAREARGRYLLLLNPDTIVRDNVVRQLLDFACARPDAAAWGGVTLLRDGRIDPGCMQSGEGMVSVCCHAIGLGRYLHGGLPPEARRVAEVKTLSGALMMVRADVWRDIGGFDESFFMYNEEADLCRRIAQAGWRVLMTPHTHVTHLVGRSSDGSSNSRRMLAQMKGRMHFVRKHCSTATATLHGLIGWFHAANRVAGSIVATPMLGAERARRIRATWLPLAARPSDWWWGWSRRAADARQD